MVTRTVERSVDRDAPTTTTVIERSGGGGATAIVLALILLAVVAIGGYFALQASRNDSLRTNAVAEAAGSVSGAAKSVGGAADRAADSIASPAAPAPANQ